MQVSFLYLNTAMQLANQLKLSRRTIVRDIEELKSKS